MSIDQFETRLRMLMHSAVGDLTPSGERRVREANRHRPVMVGFVAALGIAVTAAFITAQHRPSQIVRTDKGEPAATAAPVTDSVLPDTDGVTPALPPSNSLDWAYRGNLVVEGPASIDVQAGRAWADKHSLREDGTLVIPLWSSSIGHYNAVLVSASKLSSSPESGTSYLVMYVRSSTAEGTIVRDEPSNPDLAAIAQRLQLGGSAFDVVIGPPGATIKYAPDGQTVTDQAPLVSGDGWAVYGAAPERRAAAEVAACAGCKPSRVPVR